MCEGGWASPTQHLVLRSAATWGGADGAVQASDGDPTQAILDWALPYSGPQGGCWALSFSSQGRHPAGWVFLQPRLLPVPTHLLSCS